MAFAITKSCCTDASCVSVCPVGCIHPAPGEPGFGTSEILHIDPQACIDCGACADACPVQAIFPVDKLSPADRVYEQINADYRQEPWPQGHHQTQQRYPRLAQSTHPLKVAVIGSGPAGMYTVKELLTRTEASVTVIDALPTPGGLLRSGVASDHQATKRIQRVFDIALRHPRVTFLGGVQVGRDVLFAEVRSHFDAVFVATGARNPRRLGVPGENRSDVVSALDVARWAGGEPGFETSPLSSPSPPSAPERAVIVGTGNVALDVVRLFTCSPETLEHNDIADRALDVLRHQPIRDVVVLARGSSQHAAYTEAEYRGLSSVAGLEIRVIEADESTASVNWDIPAHPRVTFVFGTYVQEFTEKEDGALRVTVSREQPAETHSWPARVAVVSIGQTYEPLPGLPQQPPEAAGEARLGEPGIYLVGWAKRGALGGIGANRQCATDSVNAFIDDVATLPSAPHSHHDFSRALRRAGVAVVDRRGSTRIDAHEVRAGVGSGRPRVKLTDLEDLRRAAKRHIGSR